MLLNVRANILWAGEVVRNGESGLLGDYINVTIDPAYRSYFCFY